MQQQTLPTRVSTVPNSAIACSSRTPYPIRPGPAQLLPDLPDLPSIYAAGPLAPRVIAGVAGLLLLLGGRRLYRVAVVLPGLLFGLGAGVVVGGLIQMPTVGIVVLAVAGGAAGALLAGLVERVAVAFAGILAGIGVIQLGWPLAAISLPLTPEPPWWTWPIAAIAGALVFPYLWRAALIPLTAGIGALVLVDVAGLGANPFVVLGVAVFGVIVQVATSTGRRREEER